MTRKKWTPKNNVTDSLLQFREKRKWQIALRRYVLEKQKCHFYAPYFGLDAEKFRLWIELQFDKTLNWDNFSASWQFDHVIPLAYFDFQDEQDLRLCWNFINIQIAKTDKTVEKGKVVDVLIAKRYFKALYHETGYPLCATMLSKIKNIEEAQLNTNKGLTNFIIHHKEYLSAAQKFTSEDFERLNTGTDINELLAEKEFLKKFGS